jgi:hypothetical protein
VTDAVCMMCLERFPESELLVDPMLWPLECSGRICLACFEAAFDAAVYVCSQPGGPVKVSLSYAPLAVEGWPVSRSSSRRRPRRRRRRR